jgi:Protein of unknown function DUF262/Protein of unknown function (DUF1524)
VPGGSGGGRYDEVEAAVETSQTIESQDMTLGKLFDDFYVVPDYQREYIWGELEVEQLLDDVHAEFQANERTDSEYFVGSIVVCPGRDGVLELIDGQQRTTTAFLFLCALRDYLAAAGEIIQAIDPQIRAVYTDDQGRDVPRYRLVLQYADSGDILDRIAAGSIDLESIPDRTRSIENVKNAYRVIRTFLAQQFSDDPQEARRFYAFFTKRVKLIRIGTKSVAHALKIFETINDRGKGLDAMDLLKNLMFMHASSADFNLLKDNWKQLVDALYAINEKPLRFLRYFIFATYEGVERLREDEIYSWFVGHAELCGYRDRPIVFVDTLLEAAGRYANFLQGRDRDGSRNRYLENLRLLSGSARQHLILLLSARHLGPEDFTTLCREVENLFFVYVITRENTREFERKFVLWANELRPLKDRSSLDAFLQKRFAPERERLAQRFALSLGLLDSSALQHYRLRYLLGKLTQYVDEQAFGTEGHDRLGDLLGSKVDIEHIFPQTPRADVLAEFDKPEQVASYVPRLGNLVLVEKPLNTSLGNKPFGDKARVYPRSQFLLTRVISERPVVGVNTSVERALEGLSPFETWTSRSIEERQEQLTGLASTVWQMPRPASP